MCIRDRSTWGELKIQIMQIFWLLAVAFVFPVFCDEAGATRNYPIAVFHGISDECSSDWILDFVHYLSSELNTYVRCIEIGKGAISTWLMTIEEQGKEACEKLKMDSHYNGDFSIVGLSQGTIISRYVLQKCDMKGTPRRFISVGGPIMGVSALPHCEKGPFCSVVNLSLIHI
eukprot:TRINITY_DN12025_c0_g1_i1.p1 TRINITY_DN12025_c0_g1~~TRINITY_DN12025_c0_g1_i1.p1  ORF type:complete len:193 (+),score=22.21 TRINITY_DN12025_c0_g1_i1:61-579(+)